MKKVTLSMIAALAMSTFAVAGGDIAPVEPMVETPVIEESTGAFYLGIGYGAANYDTTITATGLTDEPIHGSGDEDYGAIMLQAGYKFNPYLAVEGRYWIGLDEDVGDNTDLNVDTWGIYVKPMYPVTNALDIYGLLGYADSDVELSDAGGSYSPPYDTDGFSWGIGASYAFSDNLSVFVDYTSLFEDDNTLTIDTASIKFDDAITSWNFGVTYTF